MLVVLLIRGNTLHLPVADHSSAERKWVGGGANAVWLIASLCFNHWYAVTPERLHADWPPMTSWKHYPQKTVSLHKVAKLTPTITYVHNALSINNTRKAVGPDNIPECVLQGCAEQLEVFTNIFNLLTIMCPPVASLTFVHLLAVCLPLSSHIIRILPV